MLQTKAGPSCFLSDPTRMKQRECNWLWGISHDQTAADGQASGWGTTERAWRTRQGPPGARASKRWGRTPHQRRKEGDFPAGPVVKTPCFQHRGQVLIPSWGTKNPTCHWVRLKKKKKGPWHKVIPRQVANDLCFSSQEGRVSGRKMTAGFMAQTRKLQFTRIQH